MENVPLDASGTPDVDAEVARIASLPLEQRAAALETLERALRAALDEPST